MGAPALRIAHWFAAQKTESHSYPYPTHNPHTANRKDLQRDLSSAYESISNSSRERRSANSCDQMLLVILRQLWTRAHKNSPWYMEPHVETDDAKDVSLLI